MKVRVSSQAKRRHFLLVAAFALISSAFSLGVAWNPAGAQAKLTLADILTGLKSTKVTLAQRNKLLTDAVWKRGVTFTLTNEIERELRTTGANDTLIDAIRQSGPSPVRTPTPRPTVSNTGNSTYYHKRGDDYFDANNFEAAIPEFTRAIQLNPNDSLAYVRRGFSYNYLGDSTSAFKDYDMALKTDPNLRNEEYIACVFYKKGDAADMIVDKCTETVTKYKEFSLAYYKRGIAYRDLGNYEQAIRDYSEAIRLYPNFAYAYNTRAVVYIDGRKNYSAAISDTTNAIRINPNFSSAYFNRGLSYFSLDNYDAALADFTRAIQLTPDDYDSYYYRGRIYYEQENNSQAIVNFSKAISLSPNEVEPYRYRGICYFNQQDYQAAIDDYTTAIRLKPTANTYKNRALAYDKLGRTDLAAADRRRA
ncbi:MAG: tetratricopeptide repeat protein, partial [Acidobacteria bacterium]|nr:tetratricopeptide repeat protein [Acidobacteriota bacterium]